MDVKDLRTEAALSERNNDGSKYTQGGVVALQPNRNKSYHDIVPTSLAKAESTPVRPCAVIGPDRVVPPPTSNDPFLKKGSLEPWPSPDNVYRRPPEYPYKLSSQNPTRNISPRQTFQENMQRIMVPPTYNVARHIDDANFSHIQDRNIPISKNAKPNMAPDAKYCDVPYAINTLTNEPKNVRDTEMYVPSVNSQLTRTASHGWPNGNVNMHSPRTYSAHELYQYPQYQSCAGQRPTVIPMNRPQRTLQEDAAAYGYPDHYYQDPSARFKPYPPVKERYQQPRYEYIGNYPSQFHPPPQMQPHKYDISKSGAHPYPVYPHLKYLENRVPEHTLEGYQRIGNQQPHYNLPFHNQVINPTYAPVSANSVQSKLYPYPPEGSIKTGPSNKLHFENNNKMYIDYENARTKTYPMPDNYYVTEMSRVQASKNQMILPNYSPIGMHSNPSQQHYRKDNTQMKPYEYLPHFRNFEPHLNNSAMLRHTPQFSPNTLAISPTDSNISNDTSQTHGTTQEDCGYVSQSPTASVRSIESSMYRLPHEYYKRYDFGMTRNGPIVGNSPTLTRSDLHSSNVNSKESKQKQIDVRQFLQMWNEGEEDLENNNSKEIVIQTGSSESSNLPLPKQHLSNQDQLYVLGLVNVPSEELSKYEHIQKISKLPENIKGYNNLELLSQFEEAIESSNAPAFKSIPKEYKMPSKENSTKQVIETLPRPLSPLDVEAKISQSVIHKEVGCNFEIKPCSPKMLNVEIAAPAQNILGERVIEKVTNPLSKTVKSPIPIKSDENSNSNCHTIKRQENNFTMNDNPSCKMIKSPYTTNNIDSVKANYSLQDLEINSGVCLASLPRLDNEIELNFLEVNQQFINANKKDVISTAKNCPQLDLVEQTSLSDSKLNEGKEEAIESDKTFTKLSKYRKSKTTASENSSNIQFTKAVRTDSVIIKNPENLKNIEDKLLENSSNMPMNLSSQLSLNNELPNETNKDSVEIALDFSLNKSNNDLPVIEMEREETLKLFTTDLPHKICENVDSQLLNSNNIASKIDPNIDSSCVENNKGVEKDAQDSFNETSQLTKSVDENVTDSLVLNDISSDSLMPENSEFINKNDVDKKISHSFETGKDRECVVSKKFDDNTTPINGMCHENYPTKIFGNCGKLLSPETEIVSGTLQNKETIESLPAKKMYDENEAKRNKITISSKNDHDFEHDEISASLEKLFQENCDNGSFDMSVSMPSKAHYNQQSKELFSPWIQKLLTHSEGLCSKPAIKSAHKELHSTNVDGPMLNNMEISLEDQSQNTNKDHENRTRDMLPLTTSNKIFTEKITENVLLKEKSITSKCYDSQPHTLTNVIKNSNSTIQDTVEDTEKLNVEDICSENSSSVLIDVKTKRKDLNKQELNKFQKSVNKIINCDPILSSGLKMDTEIKATTNTETCAAGEIHNRQKRVDNTDTRASHLENEFASNNKESLKHDFVIESIRQQEEKSQRPERLNEIIVNVSDNSQRKGNQNEETLLKDCDKNADDTSKIFDNVDVVQEDQNLGFGNISNETPENNCTAHQINKIQEESLATNVMIGNHDNSTDKMSKTLNSNIYAQKKTSDPISGNSANSVRLKYDENETKENDESEHKIENELIEMHSNDTSKSLQNVNSASITQREFNNHALESSSNNVANSLAEYPTVENYNKEENTIENEIIENHDIDTNEILFTFDSSSKDDSNSSPRILSISASNSCAEHQNKENRDEAIIMNKSDVTTDYDNNIIETVDNNISESSSEGTEREKEINQNRKKLIVNVNNDQNDTDQLRSETSNSSVISQDNTAKKDQNNVISESMLHGIFGNVDCAEHERLESVNSIGDSIKNCGNAIKTETSDNSNIIEMDQSIPPEHQITTVRDEEISSHISDSNPNKTSEILCNVVRNFNQITREDQKESNPGSLSYNVFDDCTGNQTKNDETTNEICEKIIQNPNNFTEDENTIQIESVCIDTHDSNYEMQNCVFDRWTKHEKEENTLSNKNITTAEQKCMQNEENTKCNRKAENYQENLKNNISGPLSQESSAQDSPIRSRLTLKRSISDSALHSKSTSMSDRQVMDIPLMWPSKRPKMDEYENSEQHELEENLCSIINNRRNSISSFYEGDNVSFCILIDNNCIITEENEDEKICFAEISEDCITELNTADEDNNEGEVICCSQENDLDFSETIILDKEDEKSVHESWLDNVACVETVVSDDIDINVAESVHVSPRDIEELEYESGIFNSSISEYADDINFINDNNDGETMPDNVSHVEETYGSSHEDVRRMLYDEDPEGLCSVLCSGNNLENILSETESNIREDSPPPTLSVETELTESMLLPYDSKGPEIPEDKENIFVENTSLQICENFSEYNRVIRENNENRLNEDTSQIEISHNITRDDTVQSCESSTDNVLSYAKDEDDVNVDYATFSSPEVSSTTFEEKSSSSGILLKITNYNGSRVSEVNEFRRNKPRCKFTEEKQYSNSNGSFPKRPLITKAAQKYIPPLKESICDLKVKLPLPQQSLLKLKRLKLAINEPKIIKPNNSFSTVLKKPKPNFEDVLKNIDKVQIKMHKEKKKGKNVVPKVVIKKNLNGSHYTSSLNKDTFNPDLTGRKWQPWVFIEKNRFIDSMAINNKTKAIFSHRKNTYVLAEKFKKYKSVSNCSAKFVISQPKVGDSSRGQLKYTIRLKHTH